jgi:hypothetical protein
MKRRPEQAALAGVGVIDQDAIAVHIGAEERVDVEEVGAQQGIGLVEIEDPDGSVLLADVHEARIAGVDAEVGCAGGLGRQGGDELQLRRDGEGAGLDGLSLRDGCGEDREG